MGNYPELDRVAENIANKTLKEINKKTANIRSSMPYKNQYVLEEVISLLEGNV